MGEEYLNYLKLFHYGDGTIDDTGLKRYNANTCKKIYSKEIKKLNEKFNSWENLVYFLDRFLFVGNKSELIVDALYYGDLDSGLWASREEIINFVKANSFENNNVHFGPLTYQVWGRDENRTALHPKRRYVIQIKWGNLKNNLKYIRGENYFE